MMKRKKECRTGSNYDFGFGMFSRMLFQTSVRSCTENLEWYTVTCVPKRICNLCTIWGVSEISGKRYKTCLPFATAWSINSVNFVLPNLSPLETKPQIDLQKRYWFDWVPFFVHQTTHFFRLVFWNRRASDPLEKTALPKVLYWWAFSIQL